MPDWLIILLNTGVYKGPSLGCPSRSLLLLSGPSFTPKLAVTGHTLMMPACPSPAQAPLLRSRRDCLWSTVLAEMYFPHTQPLLEGTTTTV